MSRATDRVAPEVAGVRITHAGRVIDPASGLTKIALARYHHAVAPRLLPYVASRPLALVRCPEGLWADCFYQKRRTPGMPSPIHADRVGRYPVLYVDDEAGILSLVQFGVVELHAWGSRITDVKRPDWIVMDLDPDEGLPFSRVVEAALEMRDALASIGLESFVKTTGGKGLHVVAPIVPELDFDGIKAVTGAIAEAFAERDPSRYVATMSKRARAGRIFVDYFRNGNGATAIAPYSPRAREGATVALPIAWRDLQHVHPRELTVATVPALVRKRRDPWAAFFSTKQRITACANGRAPHVRKGS